MDLLLFARVLWRFRLIVMCGFVVSLALAVLAVARIDVGRGHFNVAYRQEELWSSNSTIVLTQPGFPWGRSSIPLTPTSASTFSDPGRLSYLATFYAQLATSDAVLTRLVRAGVRGAVSATPVTDPSGRDALPFITLTGTATTASEAVKTAARGAGILIKYVTAQQRAAGIPESQRVLLEVTSAPAAATVSQPRKKTVPIFVFLALMVATVGFVFVLENLRPRRAPEPKATPIARRSARETAVGGR